MEQITTADLSKKRQMVLYARIAQADLPTLRDIRAQVANLRVARASGHGGYARQAGAKAATLDYVDQEIATKEEAR